MNVVELPKLWTEDEVAAYLGVNPETVARERRRKRLGYTLIGKKVRITAEHLKEYLRSRECIATSTDETAARTGTSTNTTSKLDNAGALALAREIVKPRKKSSPSTSSSSLSDRP